jgi:hypothetical protein
MYDVDKLEDVSIIGRDEYEEYVQEYGDHRYEYDESFAHVFDLPWPIPESEEPPSKCVSWAEYCRSRHHVS